MVFFESEEQLKQVFDAFWPRAITVKEVYEKLCKSEIIVRFDIEQPDMTVTIDFKNIGPDGKQGILSYEATEEPDIIVWSKSDVTNKFWQGKLRTSIAMAKGEVKMQGSITKGLGLIGKIKPLYAIYIEVLKDLGLNHLLI
jgi:hypothetical protein